MGIKKILDSGKIKRFFLNPSFGHLVLVTRTIPVKNTSLTLILILLVWHAFIKLEKQKRNSTKILKVKDYRKRGAADKNHQNLSCVHN